MKPLFASVRSAPLWLSAALYLACVPIVRPIGDFPLNDDWSFATTVRRLVSLHEWKPSFWQSMSLVSHSLWAVPFCIFDNCSFNALRVSTLLAGFILLFATYLLLRAAGAAPKRAALGAFIVPFNPVLFELSYTFMTDVLFTMLAVLSALLFVENLNTGSRRSLILASLTAVVATLCRQLGLFLPLSYMVVTLLRRDKTFASALKSAAPAALCGLTLALYEIWMSQTGRTPSIYYLKSSQLFNMAEDPTTLLLNCFHNGVKASLYLGLFSLPLVSLVASPKWETRSARRRVDMPSIGAVLLAVIAIIEIALTTGLMPVQGNILIPQGLGPLTLRDTRVLRLDSVPELPWLFWVLVTVLSVVGLFRLSRLTLAFLESLRLPATPGEQADRRSTALFALLCIGAYFLPILPGTVFERYFSAILPLVCLFCVSAGDPKVEPSARRERLSVAIALSWAVFAVLGTHDYFSWNRARWQAIADLKAREGASATDIDGGFEYNGATIERADRGAAPTESRFWVKNDRFLVAFGPVPGFDEIARYEYTVYLPPGRRVLLALKRHAKEPAAAIAGFPG